MEQSPDLSALTLEALRLTHEREGHEMGRETISECSWTSLLVAHPAGCACETEVTGAPGLASAAGPPAAPGDQGRGWNVFFVCVCF